MFRCRICYREYKTQLGLKLHMKKTHDISIITIIPTPAVKLRIEEFKQHFGNPTKHVCNVCNAAFLTAISLANHKWRIHKQK